LIVPNPKFRLNPSRAIHISGVISDELVTRLTPEILKLRHADRTPITVYIDSPGGSVSSMETILRLLKLPDQDSKESCTVITAVVVNAASAAADLLSSGDYAIAYPSASILYHGLRTYEKSPLTLEYTSMLSHSLRMFNDVYAMQLAKKIEDRFTFRYVFARDEFAAIRSAKNDPNLPDLECFIEVIDSKLSKEGRTVLDRARKRNTRYQDLIETVLKKGRVTNGYQSLSKLEGQQLIALIDFEVDSNDKGWSFSSGGIGRLVDDFFLLTEYIANYGGDRLKNWCTTFGRWTIPPDRLKAIEAIQDEDKRTDELVNCVQPILEPILSFFVGLCHALQDGENKLTATDAYWLGLVDEVVGESLPNARFFEEYQIDHETPEGTQGSARA
jgi:ATP-dependent protease ClpP protease subunit